MFKSIRSEKGDIAEAPETDAGLRENMSQTVTKVERCHRSGAEQSFRAASSHARPRAFHFFREARFCLPKHTCITGDNTGKRVYYLLITLKL